MNTPKGKKVKMGKQYPYYSPNNLEFNLFKYKCIIAERLIVDSEAIVDQNIIVDIVVFKKITYFIFHKNTDLSLN